MSDFEGKTLVVIQAEIGRGHPNYLDSTLRSIKGILGNLPQNLVVTSAMEESRGLSLLAWQIIRKIYQWGARGGLASKAYNLIRARSGEKSKEGLAIQLLGKSLRANLAEYGEVIVVSHPLLAQILSRQNYVYYVHGEIAAPSEFKISSVQKIFVPLEETKEQMVADGVPEKVIEVTGLMIEPELVDRIAGARESRLARLKAGIGPTFGFFNSGAYPKEHVRQIIKGITYIMEKRLGKAILSAGNDPGRFNGFGRQLSKFRPVMEPEQFKQTNHPLLLLYNPERESLTLQELRILPELDVLIAAAHERVNWALALGLPSILLLPNLGNYAKTNFEFTQKHVPVCSNEKSDIIACIDQFMQAYREKNPSLSQKSRQFNIDGSRHTAEAILKSITGARSYLPSGTEIDNPRPDQNHADYENDRKQGSEL